jgi:hypothetical protein
MHKRIPIFTGVPEDYVIRFNSPLEPETLNSTTFTTTIGTQEYDVYITDQHDITVGDIGTLVMKRVSDDVIVLSNVGNVDYTTGVVNITDLLVDPGSTTDLRVYVEPFGDAPNILTTDLTSTSNVSTAAIFPYAARNTVLTLDTSAPNSTINIPAGLSVTAVANSQE